MTAGTRVGEFFLLGEFADKRGGGLPPGTAPIAIARLCCLVLDPLRREFGQCTVNSGYRTDASNATVGGAKESRHLHHRFPDQPAADVRFARGNPTLWAQAADKLLRGGGGVGRYATHIHVDRRPTRSRWIG